MLDKVNKVEALFLAQEWKSRADKMFSTLENNSSLRENDRKAIHKEASLFRRTERLLRKAANP